MFIVNVANPGVLLLALFLTICFIYLGKEAKNAYVTLLPLIVFVILLVMHVIQFSIAYEMVAPIIARCLLVDFIMILLSYMAYLWIDDIEAKAKKKKSIDNSLQWFWKNV